MSHEEKELSQEYLEKMLLDVDETAVNFDMQAIVSSMQALNAASFNPPANYPVGTNPFAIAVGDFNNNGSPDLVVANSGDDTISVFLGNIDGTFTGPTNYNVGSGTRPFDVAIGDFNGDGKQDIVTANNGSGSVSVFLGNGDGTFQTTPVVSSVGFTPARVVVGDFNGDGKMDIATGNDGNNNVTVLFGNGTGAFTPAASYNTGGVGVFGLAAGKLKNSLSSASLPDIVAVNASSNTITVLLNNGDGTFTPQTPIPVGSLPLRATLGDFNNDGYLDIAVTNGNDNNVSVLLNKADGTGTFQPLVNYPVDAFPIGIATGDFNGDGNLDLVTANNGANNDNTGSTVSVLLGDGTGAFQAQQSISVGAAGTGPFAIATGDFNDDGYSDIAVTDAGIKKLSVLLTNRLLVVTADTIQAVAGVPFSGPVATISGAKSASDTTATIDWGDMTAVTAGTITANLDGTLTVSGSHTYAQAGMFTLTVTAHEGARNATGTGQAIVKSICVKSRAYGLLSTSSNPLYNKGPIADASVPCSGGSQTVSAPFALLPNLVVIVGVTDKASGTQLPTTQSDASSVISQMSGLSDLFETLVATNIKISAHADLNPTTSVGTVSGSTSFRILIVNDTTKFNYSPAPNTVMNLPGLGILILNEQMISTQSGSVSIAVNALHFKITKGFLKGTDIVIGHAEASAALV